MPEPILGTDVRATKEVAAALARIDAAEADIKAFIEILANESRHDAETLDRIAPSERGLLHGLPVAIKEVIDVKGALCPWGARPHAERRAAADATAVARLRQQGAVIMGTLVSTEYAIAAAGPTRNPRDPERTPGGSSSGPAAAVAAGMVPLAVGSQTIGSVIRPALYCGVPGFKPSYGAINLEGVMPLAPGLDHLGLFAADWRLLCQAFQVLADTADTPAQTPGRCLVVSAPSDLRLSNASRAAMDRARARIERAGYALVEAPDLGAMRNETDPLAKDLVTAGLACHHGGNMDNDADSLSPTARALMQKGRAFSDAEIGEMDRRLAALRQAADNAIRPGDLVLSDAIEDVAPPWSADHTGPNRLQAIWSVLGLPTTAWTVGDDPATGLPVGVQLSSARGTDVWLLHEMERLERR